MIKSTRACPVALILICRAALISIHLSCRSHLHTLVGLFSFPFVVSLSSYSGRATLILHCRVALNTAVGLRSFYIECRGKQKIIEQVTRVSCGAHSYTAVGPCSFCIVVSLSFPYSGWTPRAVQGWDVGRPSPRVKVKVKVKVKVNVKPTGCDLVCSHWSVSDGLWPSLLSLVGVRRTAFSYLLSSQLPTPSPYTNISFFPLYLHLTQSLSPCPWPLWIAEIV